MKSYKEYVMNESLTNACDLYFTEAFSLNQVSYGTNEDYNDKGWEKVANKISAYFLSGETLFRVDLISDGNMYHVKFSYKKDNEFTYEMKFDLQSSLSLFNRVMYVVNEGVNKFNINKLGFGNHPSNKKLDSVYNRMVTNKTFKNIMSSGGFIYKGKEEDIHVYEREN